MSDNLPERTDYTPEEKRAIVDDAVESLSRGSTVKAIALRHGIAAKRLTAWLIVDERADKARAQFIGGKLADALDGMENATDQLQLAKHEKTFKSWSWVAERRLGSMFAPPKDTGVQVPVQINIGINRATGESRTITVNQVSATDGPQY